MQEGGTGWLRHRLQMQSAGPLAQSGGISGERQTAADEQSGEFVGPRCGGREQQKNEQKPGYLRNSISIGPSRRPWVN